MIINKSRAIGLPQAGPGDAEPTVVLILFARVSKNTAADPPNWKPSQKAQRKIPKVVFWNPNYPRPIEKRDERIITNNEL